MAAAAVVIILVSVDTSVTSIVSAAADDAVTDSAIAAKRSSAAAYPPPIEASSKAAPCTTIALTWLIFSSIFTPAGVSAIAIASKVAMSTSAGIPNTDFTFASASAMDSPLSYMAVVSVVMVFITNDMVPLTAGTSATEPNAYGTGRFVKVSLHGRD